MGGQAWAAIYVRSVLSSDGKMESHHPAFLCEQAADQVSLFYDVPARLLRAMALVETGIYHPRLMSKLNLKSKRKPWPWTLQVAGKSYYFDTKKEAVQAADALLARGVRNFDVGCMQINMQYHAHAFPNMDAAFTPVYNVHYATMFLMTRKDASRSWEDAAASYHSKTPSRGRDYGLRVRKAMLSLAQEYA